MSGRDLESLLSEDAGVRPLEDARSEFYFAHRDLIETWAALRRDAATQLAERLFDLSDRVELDLAELGVSEVIVEGERTGSYGRVKVARESWIAAGSEVWIGVEWEAKPLNAKGDVRAYACVRLPADPRRPADEVGALTDSLRASMPGWSSSRPQWPVWRYVKPASVTADGIVSETRRDFLRLWVGISEVVDSWVRQRNNQTHVPG